MEIEWLAHADKAEVIWCNLTVAGRWIIELIVSILVSDRQLVFFSFRNVANSSNEATLSDDHLTRAGKKKEGGWERANLFKVIFWLLHLLAACRWIVDETTKARSNTSPRKERLQKHEFNFNCYAFRSLEVWRFFFVLARAKHTPNIDTNFTSPYIVFTSRCCSPLWSEFVFFFSRFEFQRFFFASPLRSILIYFFYHLLKRQT